MFALLRSCIAAVIQPSATERNRAHSGAKDPEHRRKMFEGGFEVVAVPLEMMPTFMKERSAEYLNSAKTLGLVK